MRFWILSLLFLGILAGEASFAQIYVDPSTAGQNWGVGDGLLMFRGNPQRNFYGTGPLPNTRPRTL